MADNFVEGDKELIAKFRSLSEAGQEATLTNIAKAGGTVVRNAAKDNIKKQGLIRTRNLSRDVDVQVVESSSTSAAVAVGTNLEYAAIHEFGGTIRAKKGKYLTIPVGTRRGSPLKHPDLKLRKTGSGNLVMVDPDGSVQYVLKQSVEIPARPYLRPAADENHSQITNTMASAWKQQLDEAIR